MAFDSSDDRLSEALLQLQMHARKVRGLRHRGDFFNCEFP